MLSKEVFMSVLNNMSGHATNKVMRQELACEAGEYQMIRSELLKEGLIKLGRGRGGTVHINIGTDSAPISSVTDPFPEGWR